MLERALERQFRLVRLPPYYYSADARQSIVIASDVLGRARLCVFGLPPHPVDVDAFFLVRAHLGLHAPFVYMPLGEFPRGAWAYRHVCGKLTSQDMVLFSSRADKAVYDAVVATSPARTAMIPFGIDTNLFRPPTDLERSTTRRHLGLPENAVVFIYHGRIMAEKNVHGVISTFCHLSKTQPMARLWILGGLPQETGRGPGTRTVAELPHSPLVRTFRLLLEGSGLADRVLFWGGVSHQALPQILGAADIAINLTLYEDENFGFGPVEAMSCGLPVIGTDWGGLKDTIQGEETGLLIPTVVTACGPAFDRWSACQAAARLAGDGALRSRMGGAARKRVLQLFSLPVFEDRLARQLLALLAPSRNVEESHRWTALGKRLDRIYSAERDGRRTAEPVPLSPSKYREHPILLPLLLPYATGGAEAALSVHGVYQLATDLMQLRGTRLRSLDPRYALDTSVETPAERAIVTALLRAGFLDYASLLRAVPAIVKVSAYRAALCQLLRSGVVLQSKR
jgi:glycosyltransferase involved in cell wall biosynthesis